MMARVTNRTKQSCVLAKASNAFGKLTRKLWKRHDKSLSTKIVNLTYMVVRLGCYISVIFRN